MTDKLKLYLDLLRSNPQTAGDHAQRQQAMCDLEAAMEQAAFERRTLLEALERASHELEGRVSELSLLRRISEVMAEAVENEKLVGQILTALEEEQNIEDSALWVAEGDELIWRGGLGRGRPDAGGSDSPLASLELGQGLIGQAATRHEALVVHDGLVEARCRNADPFLRQGSFCIFPLLCSGRLIGVLWLGSTERYAFPAGRVRVLTMAAGQIAQGLAGSELFGKLSRFTEGLSELVAERSRALEEKSHELLRYQATWSDLCQKLQSSEGQPDVQSLPGCEPLRQALVSLRSLAANYPELRPAVAGVVKQVDAFRQEYERHLANSALLGIPAGLDPQDAMKAG